MIIQKKKGCEFMFEPWQLGVLDEAGYNGIRDEHIERVAESLLSTGLTEIVFCVSEKRGIYKENKT